MRFSERKTDMAKDSKILFGIIAATVLLIFAGIFVLGKNAGQVNEQAQSEVLGIKVTPTSYDLGEVPIGGGIVTKEYSIKNTTDKTIKLKKIATSCMCTTASVDIGGKSTKFFGMEGYGDANPPVNIEIGNDQEAKVIVKFDPAAHGPEGTGPFDRVVWLTFSDPGGIKELSFSGTVVSQ